MADNVNVTPGVGAAVRCDDVGGVYYQYVKLDAGGDGVAIPLIGGIQTVANSLPVAIASDQGVVPVIGGGIVIAQTPAITAGAYHAKDAVGGKLTFANAVRAAGKRGIIRSLRIVDKADVKAELELWLFDQDFGASADNAAFDPTDADLANCLGVIPVSTSDYFSANDNGVATFGNVGLLFQAVATSIYGQLKCVGTPTYASVSDLIVKVAIEYLD